MQPGSSDGTAVADWLFPAEQSEDPTELADWLLDIEDPTAVADSIFTLHPGWHLQAQLAGVHCNNRITKANTTNACIGGNVRRLAPKGRSYCDKLKLEPSL